VGCSKMAIVSVIVPNYNHAPYLAARLDSILAQTYDDFEVILLDDCSTDGSREVLMTYRDHPRVSAVVFNDENSGSTFRQWDKGVSLAKGRYIWIAESDDWCEPTLLAQLVAPLESDDHCMVSYCQSYCVDEKGNIRWQTHHRRLDEVMDGQRFVRDYMVRNNAICNASMALWRREGYQQLKRDFVNYTFCGDWLFWVRLALLGRVAINGRLLNYFRKHGSDVSSRAYGSGYNFVEEIQVLNTLYEERFIGQREYTNAFKYKLKDFWRKRSSIEPQQRKTVLRQFRNAPISYVRYLRALGSAIWADLKKRNY